MKSLISLALAACVFPGLLAAQNKSFDNSPVPSLDLGRYLGTWYEIARFDHSFERGMENVVAEYLMGDDGKIMVINSGWKNGKYKTAEGKARQPDPETDPAHLEVAFFMSFYSDYNVLMIDDEYQVALVGSKSPKYLWILSRTPILSTSLLGDLVREAQTRGYDTSKLIWVDQEMNDTIP